MRQNVGDRDGGRIEVGSHKSKTPRVVVSIYFRAAVNSGGCLREGRDEERNDQR